jgi:hypothetical protein
MEGFVAVLAMDLLLAMCFLVCQFGSLKSEYFVTMTALVGMILVVHRSLVLVKMMCPCECPVTMRAFVRFFSSMSPEMSF